MAGKDATKEFFLFHNVQTVLAKYESKLVVGELLPSEKGSVVSLSSEELYPVEGPFGDLIAFGDPSWYQGNFGRNHSLLFLFMLVFFFVL